MKDIAEMSNRELIAIANAFTHCENYSSCSSCPCDGILCNHMNIMDSRDTFICEMGIRMEEILEV